MKRTDIGRIEINDVTVAESDLVKPSSKQIRHIYEELITEPYSANGKIKDPPKDDKHDRRPMALPPGDGTQLAIFFEVERDHPILIDATILGTRTGIWLGQPQWRASAISLPVKPGTECEKASVCKEKK
jgi:hypothetical protein